MRHKMVKKSLAEAYALKRNGKVDDDFLSGHGDAMDEVLTDNEEFLSGHSMDDNMSDKDPALMTPEAELEESPLKRALRKRMNS